MYSVYYIQSSVFILSHALCIHIHIPADKTQIQANSNECYKAALSVLRVKDDHGIFIVRVAS